MKRNAILILITLISFDSFGQIARDKVIISMYGNYMKTNTESGVTTNKSSVNRQYLNLGTTMGLFLSDHFVLGIGINYNWGKETRSNSLFYNNNHLQIEKMKLRSKILLPGIFCGYYFPIAGKLFLNANLGLNCGKINSDYESSYAQTNNIISIIDTAYIPPVNTGLSKSSSIYYFSAQICPELSYFLSSKFSLCIGLGGIEYSLTDWKFENSACALNFNPGYWKLGIKFVL